MIVRVRELLARTIENGIAAGIRRAHKHTDKPSQAELEAAIEAAIWLEIDELFDFGPCTDR